MGPAGRARTYFLYQTLPKEKTARRCRTPPYTVLWNVSCAAFCSCAFKLASGTVGVAMGR